eukprot:5344273-Pyramimonas_sp.AAC.1
MDRCHFNETLAELGEQFSHRISLLEGKGPPSTPQAPSSVGTSLNTSDISVVTHAHGRQRRLERSIQTLELQGAVKYGRKELANPGLEGDVRYRYTHRGVVYITDASSRHEITSWRIDDASTEERAPLNEVGVHLRESSHTVLVVDASGSMRKVCVPHRPLSSLNEYLYELGESGDWTYNGAFLKTNHMALHSRSGSSVVPNLANVRGSWICASGECA